MKMRFFNNCVGWNPADVNSDGGLCDMISLNRQVARSTFLRHTHSGDRAMLEKSLGYDAGFKMKDDWHVSYHKSLLHGITVYYFRHSGIEFVFTPTN
jgi:hypothetical protein